MLGPFDPPPPPELCGAVWMVDGGEACTPVDVVGLAFGIAVAGRHGVVMGRSTMMATRWVAVVTTHCVDVRSTKGVEQRVLLQRIPKELACFWFVFAPGCVWLLATPTRSENGFPASALFNTVLQLSQQ